MQLEVVSHVPSEASTVSYTGASQAKSAMSLYEALAALSKCGAITTSNSTVYGDFRVTRLQFEPGGGRYVIPASLVIASAARTSLALRASKLRAQLYLDWMANYLYEARAVGVASRETGSFVAALTRNWDVDQRALLGHVTLPAMTGIEYNLASRVFIAPTALPVDADEVAAYARWRAICDPLVSAGLIRVRHSQRCERLVGVLEAPPVAPRRLVVAVDAGGELPYVRATSALRIIAKELCQLVVGSASSPSLQSAVVQVLLGLSKLQKSSASVPPFVLYPHRVSWAQVAGARAWRVDLEAAIHVRLCKVNVPDMHVPPP